MTINNELVIIKRKNESTHRRVRAHFDRENVDARTVPRVSFFPDRPTFDSDLIFDSDWKTDVAAYSLLVT